MKSPLLTRPISAVPVTFFLIEKDQATGAILRYIGPFVNDPTSESSGQKIDMHRFGIDQDILQNPQYVRQRPDGKISTFEVAQMLNPDLVSMNIQILDSEISPAIPREQSPLNMYGRLVRYNFLQCWEDGYTQVAFGVGRAVVDKKRIVAIFVFTGEGKKTWCSILPKTRDADGAGRHLDWYHEKITKKELQDLIRKNKIEMEKPEDLALLLRNWII
jgi:hypothetical protein